MAGTCTYIILKLLQVFHRVFFYHYGMIIYGMGGGVAKVIFALHTKWIDLFQSTHVTDKEAFDYFPMSITVHAAERSYSMCSLFSRGRSVSIQF